MPQGKCSEAERKGKDKEMIDRNGYSDSLLNDCGEDYRRCYHCGKSVGKIDRHEVFFGANRDNSKRYGMWCDLCRECHTEVHQGDGQLNYLLKREAQELFEQSHTREEFVRIFGKNYL